MLLQWNVDQKRGVRIKSECIFKYLGHPLFNDNEYGGDRILKGTTFSKYKTFIDNCFEILPRQALHAKSLGFTHPKTGVWHQYESDLPTDMLAVLEKWDRYSTGHTQMKEEEVEGEDWD